MVIRADSIYTLGQVCEVTSLSKSTIYRLRKAEEFVPHLSLSSGRIGFLIADVHRWLANRPSGWPEPDWTEPDWPDFQKPEDQMSDDQEPEDG